MLSNIERSLILYRMAHQWDEINHREYINAIRREMGEEITPDDSIGNRDREPRASATLPGATL